MKLTHCQVQELEIAFIHFLVEVLGRQVHGDMYALAYNATEHWIVPLALAKRAEMQRQYYAQLPELWFDIMHPIDSDYDPEGKLRDFPAMSLFLPILEVLRELLCFSPLNRVDERLWGRVTYHKGLPVLKGYGKQKVKKDTQTQEEFDALVNAPREPWIPPKELIGISAQTTSLARSQITDIRAYSDFVQYGQQKGETDQDFKARMFSFLKSFDQHKKDLLLKEQKHESARLKTLAPLPTAPYMIDVVSLQRQLQRASTHLEFLWMGIGNTRVDQAIQNNLSIEDGILTKAEQIQLHTLDQRWLYLAPMRFFTPTNDSAGRTNWFMQMIQFATKLATDRGEGEKKFRSLEVSEGRVKALDFLYAQAIKQNGGSARVMTEREIELLNAHLLRHRAELQEQRSGFG
ncbi:MAG: hypothetical protein GY821_00670, partial [Gammaproteobacteria bacterium]|nr:hypothetical protein [Gammaproteobacteria bacterium]